LASLLPYSILTALLWEVSGSPEQKITWIEKACQHCATPWPTPGRRWGSFSRRKALRSSPLLALTDQSRPDLAGETVIDLGVLDRPKPLTNLRVETALNS
jgi:hypothetical protein